MACPGSNNDLGKDGLQVKDLDTGPFLDSGYLGVLLSTQKLPMTHQATPGNFLQIVQSVKSYSTFYAICTHK